MFESFLDLLGSGSLALAARLAGTTDDGTLALGGQELGVDAVQSGKISKENDR